MMAIAGPRAVAAVRVTAFGIRAAAARRIGNLVVRRASARAVAGVWVVARTIGSRSAEVSCGLEQVGRTGLARPITIFRNVAGTGCRTTQSAERGHCVAGTAVVDTIAELCDVAVADRRSALLYFLDVSGTGFVDAVAVIF
jgi:hypothetical protein